MACFITHDPGHHRPACYNYSGYIKTPGSHEMSWNDLIACWYHDHSVELVRFHHHFDAVRYYFPAGELVLHACMPHCYTIAYPDSIEFKWDAARHSNSGFHSLRKLIKMNMTGYDLIPGIHNSYKRQRHFFIYQPDCF